MSDPSKISSLIGGFSLASVLEECFLFGFFLLVQGLIDYVPSPEARDTSRAFFGQGPLEIIVGPPSGRVKPQQPEKRMTPLEGLRLEHDKLAIYYRMKAHVNKKRNMKMFLL